MAKPAKTVRPTSSPVDDGAAAVAALVTARRVAWERAQWRSAPWRSAAPLAAVAVTGAAELVDRQFYHRRTGLPVSGCVVAAGVRL